MVLSNSHLAEAAAPEQHRTQRQRPLTVCYRHSVLVLRSVLFGLVARLCTSSMQRRSVRLLVAGYTSTTDCWLYSLCRDVIIDVKAVVSAVTHHHHAATSSLIYIPQQQEQEQRQQITVKHTTLVRHINKHLHFIAHGHSASRRRRIICERPTNTQICTHSNKSIHTHMHVNMGLFRELPRV